MECKTRTNLPINHCAEMLTLTLRSGAGLFAQPLSFTTLSIFPKNFLSKATARRCGSQATFSSFTEGGW
ncbi:hypothetical protein FAJ35_07910 [Streptococcus suis]|uniref:Uncharacterized protein n=1 Tax=Streptococcus suis TaxID=1307 RepID=A0A4T2GRU8_STRSU|nr:hypothetical protein FAJ35_07910 [Streptococcus suis]